MLADFDLHPTLPASDLQRARKFYQDVLGFSPEGEMEPEMTTTFRSGNATFEVFSSQFAGTNKATAAGWVVEDLEATVSDLRSKGIRFEEYDLPEMKTVEGILKGPDGSKAAWFKDSEGNILGLFMPGTAS